jgi:hypothetical protein
MLLYLDSVTESFLEGKKITEQQQSGRFTQFHITEPFSVVTSPQNCVFVVYHCTVERSNRLTVYIQLSDQKDLTQLIKLDDGLKKLCCSEAASYNNFVLQDDRIRVKVVTGGAALPVTVCDIYGKRYEPLSKHEFVDMFHKKTQFCQLTLLITGGWKEEKSDCTMYFPTITVSDIVLYC